MRRRNGSIVVAEAPSRKRKAVKEEEEEPTQQQPSTDTAELTETQSSKVKRLSREWTSSFLDLIEPKIQQFFSRYATEVLQSCTNKKPKRVAVRTRKYTSPKDLFIQERKAVETQLDENKNGAFLTHKRKDTLRKIEQQWLELDEKEKETFRVRFEQLKKEGKTKESAVAARGKQKQRQEEEEEEESAEQSDTALAEELTNTLYSSCVEVI